MIKEGTNDTAALAGNMCMALSRTSMNVPKQHSRPKAMQESSIFHFASEKLSRALNINRYKAMGRS